MRKVTAAAVVEVVVGAKLLYVTSLRGKAKNKVGRGKWGITVPLRGKASGMFGRKSMELCALKIYPYGSSRHASK